MKMKLFKKHFFLRFIKSSLWFVLGALLGFFFFVSFLYIFYERTHEDLIYNGVMVDGIDFGGKSSTDVQHYFTAKNRRIQKTVFILSSGPLTATVSAKQLNFGYDQNLLAQQAYTLGRSGDTISDMSIILQAYFNGINLPPAYHYNKDMLNRILKPIQQQINIKPVDAKFTIENGKVTTFQLSQNGRRVDMQTLQQMMYNRLIGVAMSNKPERISLPIPIITVKPAISSDKGNDLGINELIGEGQSLFHGSIPNRIYNIELAASRLNGTLISPGQIFSFDQTVGDISVATGYKQAYVIENHKTVMGDGGGVCQVSTTLFRAALYAGLPIIERNPHAYRVGYYEQNAPPGIDAAVYYPTVDLKFKNDTGHYLLIQSYVDEPAESLTFDLYGTKDDRQVAVSTPVITSQTPAPPPVYQDDPALPKGQVQQVDFAADGANVYFTRTVTKNGKIYLSDKFVSNYQPWQAIYLRGTGT